MFTHKCFFVKQNVMVLINFFFFFFFFKKIFSIVFELFRNQKKTSLFSCMITILDHTIHAYLFFSNFIYDFFCNSNYPFHHQPSTIALHVKDLFLSYRLNITFIQRNPQYTKVITAMGSPQNPGMSKSRHPEIPTPKIESIVHIYFSNNFSNLN